MPSFAIVASFCGRLTYVHVCPLSGWVFPVSRPYPAGYVFPVPFGVLAFASWTILSRWRICRRCRWFTGLKDNFLPFDQTPIGVITFRTVEMRLGWASSVLRGHGVLVPGGEASGTIL